MSGRVHAPSRTAFRVVLMLTIALIVLVAGTVAVDAATSPAASTASSPILAGHPAVALPAPASGPAAVSALGVRLPEVAKAYGMTSAQLTYRFGQDKHLKVDKNGYLLYNDPAPTAGDLAAGAMAAGATLGAAPQALAPLTDTFKLHSLPRAAHIVYLDFDGLTMHANAWTAGYNHGADIVAPPFDTDGIPSSFSDAELTAIQQIWQRVAEDYAPFNVDVTTEYKGEDYITRSSSSDNLYGMRVLISPMSSYVGQYGGIAYVGVFNTVGDYYKPALVFPENLAKNERYIAEAAAHENGHTLGLSHDGTTTGTEYYSGQGSGATGWAPIMGVGYYQQLTQWSKGEYANANNKQDDIAVIASYGVPLRTDDVGSALASAMVLGGSGTLTAGGIVGSSTDADYFQVTSGAGTLAVSVAIAERGPDLDIALELQNAAGTVIASDNPTDLLTAGLSTTVGAGTYYIVVRGTGKGDPLAMGYTGYGSIGAYAITASVPAAGGNAAPTAKITTDKTSGYAPLAVHFSGTGSTDSDGTIASYSWTFGDGGTSTSATVAHTYSAVGTYTATLKVTDNLGATNSTTVSITITQDPAKILKVASITLSRILSGGRYYTRAVVKLVNGNGTVVSSAVVTGKFTGVVTGTVSGTTGSAGTVTLSSARYTTKTTATFTVTGVTKSGYVYRP